MSRLVRPQVGKHPNTKVMASAAKNVVQTKPDVKENLEGDSPTTLPLTIKALCPQLSKTCAAWDITKCLKVCPVPPVTNPPTPPTCVTELTWCGYAGDTYTPSYTITPTQLSPGSLYLTGTLSIANTSSVTDYNAEVPILAKIYNKDNFVIGTFSGVLGGTNASPYKILRNTVVGLPFSVPLLLSVCEGPTPITSVVLTITYSTTISNFASTLPFAVSCDISCDCIDTKFEVVDQSTETRGTDTTTYEYTLSKAPESGTQLSFTGESITIGELSNNGDNDNTATCGVSPHTVKNTATIKPKSSDNNACGLNACCASASTKLTLNCAAPSFTSLGVLKTSYADNWCLCKYGELVPKCVVTPDPNPGPTGTPCVLSAGAYSTSGPGTGVCDGCNTTGKNVWPVLPGDVLLLGGTTSGLTAQQACLFLQSNTSIATCLGLSDTQLKSWRPFIIFFRQYIATLLNILKLKFIPDCLKKTIDDINTALASKFTTYEGIKKLLLSPSIPDPSKLLDKSLINQLGNVLDLFNTGEASVTENGVTYTNPCFGTVIHCPDSSNEEYSLNEFAPRINKLTTDDDGEVDANTEDDGNNDDGTGTGNNDDGNNDDGNTPGSEEDVFECTNCSDNLAKYTITASNSPLVTTVESSLTVTINPNSTCIEYAKTFHVVLYDENKIFIDKQDVIIVAKTVGETTVTFTNNFKNGEVVTVEVSYLPTDYTAADCMATTSTNENKRIYLSHQNVTFAATCTAGTTSTLTDSLSPLPSSCPAGTKLEIATPDCTAVTSCDKEILAKTELFLTYTVPDLDPNIASTVYTASSKLCDGTSLSLFLGNISKPIGVDLASLFNHIFNNFNACGSGYTTSFDLVFYVKVPDCLKGTSLKNTAKIDTKSNDPLNHTASSTTGEVVLNIPN